MTYTLSGRSSPASAAYAGSITLKIGPGTDIQLLDLSLNALGGWFTQVPIPPTGVAPASVTAFGVSLDTPGSGPTVSGSPEPGNALSFSFTQTPVRFSGIASHESVGLTCAFVSANGTPCTASFQLNQTGSHMGVVSGWVPVSGVGAAQISLGFVTPLNPAAPFWGEVNSTSNWSVEISGPICQADFNSSGAVTVQDLFDFLTAWFAGDPQADITGGGLGVQDIFDFLSLWFVGC